MDLVLELLGGELNNIWDTSGATNQDDLVDVSLVDLRVSEDLLNELEGAPEQVPRELCSQRRLSSKLNAW